MTEWLRRKVDYISIIESI